MLDMSLGTRRAKAEPNSKTSMSTSPEPDAPTPADEKRYLELYFRDLYGVFMKRLAQFILNKETPEKDTVKLEKMLKELINVKCLLAKK